MPAGAGSRRRTTQDIDFDLLLAGVILHDIGKIHELNVCAQLRLQHRGPAAGAHHDRAAHGGGEAAADAGFPAPLRDLLLHMILSHHGELEFGSPKVPLFPEALLLHHLDNLDSKMEHARAYVERDRLVEGSWTAYSSPMDRSLLKKQKYLEPPGPPVAPGPPEQDGKPSVKPERRPAPHSDFAAKLRGAIEPHS